MKKLALLSVLAMLPSTTLLSACGSAVEPLASVVVTGTVTFGGAPVPGGVVAIHTGGAGIVHAGIDGGGYRVATDLDPSQCALVGIAVSATDALSTVVGEANEFIGSCGEHVVDFAF